MYILHFGIAYSTSYFNIILKIILNRLTNTLQMIHQLNNYSILCSIIVFF